MIFTTLSPKILSYKTIYEIYRCRWQIEIAIKRLKSLLDIDKLRAAKKGVIADIWLNGKLLYALMLEKLMHRQVDNCGNLNKERKGTKWRLLKLVKQQIEHIITGVEFWIMDNFYDAIEVLFERPRRRKLQNMPKTVRKLLAFAN
jgi:hypothetical protein